MKVAFFETALRGAAKESELASRLMTIAFERILKWPKSKAPTKESPFKTLPYPFEGCKVL